MPVSTVELRRRAKATIDRLSGPRLRFATDFLAYVQRRQLDAATKELLDTPGFLESFARGTKDVRAGRVKPWRKVRRDV
jgi:hypothetical protein